MKEIITQYRISINKLIIYIQEVKFMKKTKAKVVNLQEYKEKKKYQEVDRNELIALIKQIVTSKQEMIDSVQELKNKKLYMF